MPKDADTNKMGLIKLHCTHMLECFTVTENVREIVNEREDVHKQKGYKAACTG